MEIKVSYFKLLLSIFDELDEFNDDFKEVAQARKGRDVLLSLETLAEGKDGVFSKLFVSKKEKEFYYKHKKVFDKIKETQRLIHPYYGADSDISSFLFSFYYDNGELNKENSFGYFYDYLKNHDVDREQLFCFLEQLEVLKINKLKFDPSFEVDDEIFDNRLLRFKRISIFENMKSVPHYDCKYCYYQALPSRYVITRDGNDSEWRDPHFREITVSTLDIPASSLPRSIENEDINKMLSDMSRDTRELSADINRSVRLDVMCDEFGLAISSLERSVSEFSDSDIYPELQNALNMGRKALEMLGEQKSGFNERLLSSHPEYSQKELDSQQRYYQLIKSLNSADID